MFSSLLAFISLFKETPSFSALSISLFTYLQACSLFPSVLSSGVQTTESITEQTTEQTTEQITEQTSESITEQTTEQTAAPESTSRDNCVAFLLSLVNGSALAACLPNLTEAVHKAVDYETDDYLFEIAIQCLEHNDDMVTKVLLEKEWKTILLPLRLLKEEKVRACVSLADVVKAALKRVL